MDKKQHRNCYQSFLLWIVATLLLQILPTSVHAQYNRSSMSTWNNGRTGFAAAITSTARDVVDADPGNKMVLGLQTDFPLSPYIFDPQPNDIAITLKKINAAGVVLNDWSYLISDTFRLEPWRLIQTPDQGYIIVGRAYDPQANPRFAMHSNPFAMKVDMNGVQQWKVVYKSNTIAFPDSVHTAIVRVEDDSIESYMIVRSGAPVNSYAHRGDVLINALKIDGVTGASIWNRKYQVQSHSAQDTIIRDYPTALTYVDDSSGKFYFIAGANRIVRAQEAGDSSLFVIGIDRYGNVVRPYRYIRVPSFPSDADAIWDSNPAEKSIVLSYSQRDSRIVDPTMSVNRSQIGLLKLGGNFNIKTMRYYWSPQLYENRSARITRNSLDGAYVLACNVRDSASGSAGKTCMGLLKIGKSGAPVFYNRYNYRREAKAFGLLSFTDPASPDEYYSMVGHKEAGSAAFRDLKILATDAGGYTCGMRQLTVHDSAYTDSLRLRSYIPVDSGEDIEVAVWQIFPTQFVSDCDSTISNGDHFRKSNPTALASGSSSKAGEIRVYPTVLKEGANSITIEVTNSSSPAMQLRILGMDGRMIATREIVSAEQNKRIVWRLPELPGGCYVLSVSGGNGSQYFNLVQQ